MIATRIFFPAAAVVLLLTTAGFAPPAAADDPDSEKTEAEYVRDLSLRIGNVERRINALENYLSQDSDMHVQQPSMRSAGSARRELMTGPSAMGGSLDEFARMQLKLDGLDRKARDAQKRLDRHEARYVDNHEGSADGPADDKSAEKSRRKIGSRIAQIERDLDEMDRDLRYLR